MDSARSESDSTDLDHVAERTPTPGNQEFPELRKPDFGQTRFYTYSLLATGVAGVALGIVFLVMQEALLGAVVLGIGVLVVLGAGASLRRMKRIERDPEARNPQDNAVNRSLLRLRRDHPVIYGVLLVVTFAIFLYTAYLRWIS